MSIKERLNELNFKELIQIDSVNPAQYSANEYINNGLKHNIKGFCISCETNGVNISNGNINFKLSTIGHGAHSIDYAHITPNFPDVSDWNNDGVLFLFQTPPQIYESHFSELEYHKYVKYPTYKWYFALKEKLALSKFPANFQGKKYDDFIVSIINTFKLKNAYFTDLVKCGLCYKKENLNIRHFSQITINNCVSKFLLKEIDILKPKVIFSFGTDTTEIVNRFIDKIPIIQLPHPRARGLSSDYFATIYFWKILSGLVLVGIIDKENLNEYMNLFNNSHLKHRL